MSHDLFEDGDPFDPEALERHEAAVKAAVRSEVVDAEGELRRRRQAYIAVFTAGERSQADIDIVLCDLMFFCKMLVSTYNIADGPHAQVLMHMKEGRREVFQRIKDFTRLDFDVLFAKYTGALSR